MRKFAKFKNKIPVTMFKKRDLTLEGKELVINSYIISSMSYLVDVYTDHIPNVFIKQIRELICDFLWTGSTLAYFSKGAKHEKMEKMSWRSRIARS